MSEEKQAKRRIKGRQTFSRGSYIGLRFDDRQWGSSRAYITIRGNDSITHDCATMGELEWCLKRIEEDIAKIRKIAPAKFRKALWRD